jgi:hypothetical protein
MSPLTRSRQAPPVVLIVVAAVAVTAWWMRPAGAAPDSLAEAERAVKAAEEAQNAVQRSIAQTIQRQELTQAQHADATRRMGELSLQASRLQAVVAARARSTYMTGSPASVAAVVGVTDTEDLLDKIETIYRLAEISNDTLRDLVELQRVVDETRRALAAMVREQQALEARFRAELAEADRILAERVRVEDELRARDAARAEALADAAYQARVGSIRRGAGGLCDLSGMPSAARNIILRESGGNPYADNPRSTAFGLGQLLEGNRRAFLGADYDSVDCDKQYSAFRQYVMGRYGSFSAAWAFWQAHHWY